MVVVRPGTGEILAVSSNETAAAGNALTGRYPPGSSMKAISATSSGWSASARTSVSTRPVSPTGSAAACRAAAARTRSSPSSRTSPRRSTRPSV
ncbi:penicillin-binding transpeptidase domain-containing protein [Geodermatophilus sp. DF01-2]|uniref:penicillin-binding transpeptidase domain-containing protein n=1 Tax=Geodermatophilus sp. DF01-2 TaxID=2559610 RepID=UPI0032AF7C6C